MKPTRDRILVKPLESESVTASGIVIPDNAQEKPSKGTVVAAGSGRVTDEGIVIPMEVKQGDVVMYSKFAGQTVKINNQEHIVLKEEDVLAIIE
jgi:chaperonin GroES